VEVRSERLLEGAEVAAASRIARGSGTEVGVGDKGQGLWFGLAEAARLKAKRLAARLDGGNCADEIFLVGPEMNEASAMIGRDGAVGETEIEKETAIFKDGGVGVVGEKGIDGASEDGWIGSSGGLHGRGGGSGGRHQLRWSAPAAARSREKLPAHTLS
jgi:hypothetical protein